MYEMVLPFRYRIRNSSPSSLRPITLVYGHGGSINYIIYKSDPIRFVSLKTDAKAVKWQTFGVTKTPGVSERTYNEVVLYHHTIIYI